MSMPGIPDNQNDTITSQHKGIIHLAFGVETIGEVDEKAGNCRQMVSKFLRVREKPEMDIMNLKRLTLTTTG